MSTETLQIKWDKRAKRRAIKNGIASCSLCGEEGRHIGDHCVLCWEKYDRVGENIEIVSRFGTV